MLRQALRSRALEDVVGADAPPAHMRMTLLDGGAVLEGGPAVWGPGEFPHVVVSGDLLDAQAFDRVLRVQEYPQPRLAIPQPAPPPSTRDAGQAPRRAYPYRPPYPLYPPPYGPSPQRACRHPAPVLTSCDERGGEVEVGVDDLRVAVGAPPQLAVAVHPGMRALDDPAGPCPGAGRLGRNLPCSPPLLHRGHCCDRS